MFAVSYRKVCDFDSDTFSSIGFIYSGGQTGVLIESDTCLFWPCDTRAVSSFDVAFRFALQSGRPADSFVDFFKSKMADTPALKLETTFDEALSALMEGQERGKAQDEARKASEIA